MVGEQRSRKKSTKEAVRQALIETHGEFTAAARLLGYRSRKSVFNWVRAHRDLQELVYHLREEVLDVAESHHFQKVQEGDSRHVLFHLRTQGRKRGYIERREAETVVHSAPLTKHQLAALFRSLPPADQEMLRAQVRAEWGSYALDEADDLDAWLAEPEEQGEGVRLLEDSFTRRDGQRGAGEREG